ncbi:hypothetical protein JCM19037_4691 [Geomicrobium sp. JCM 19037]|uniref:hypothetical protein n=1 Tax=unclassified Geomicrobium TaxID=2628951 RepID=UPI00045F3EC6|nr:hypothetical protein [Geomicrobium sp. JCM 19037]GAK06118.1 hypothetical protein JCM19037_4691 [Geomicrobium sp. JCM 19037]
MRTVMVIVTFFLLFGGFTVVGANLLDLIFQHRALVLFVSLGMLIVNLIVSIFLSQQFVDWVIRKWKNA